MSTESHNELKTTTAAWRPPRCGVTNAGLPQAFEHKQGSLQAFSVRFLSSTGAGTESVSDEPDEKLTHAFEEGYQAGLAEGKKLGRSEQTAHAVAAVGTLLSQIRRESRNIVIELCKTITAHILKKEIEQNPKWVLHNAHAVLAHQAPNGAIKVRLCPADRELILAQQPPPSWITQSDGNLTLVADADLQPGDCVLESERTRIDGRTRIQLERLHEVLQEMVVGTLFTEEP